MRYKGLLERAQGLHLTLGDVITLGQICQGGAVSFPTLQRRKQRLREVK